MTVYKRIQLLCKQYGITVTKLEKEFHKSRGFYQKWATSMPNTANLIEIADYFNVSLDYLVGREQRISDEAVDTNVEIAVNDELREMIEKFLKLNNKKQAHVSELINLLSE